MGWYGAPFYVPQRADTGPIFFLKISFPPQPEARKQENWVVENRADTEPQKTGAVAAGSVSAVLFLGLRISSSNASHRRTDDWAQTFGKLLENHTGSLSAFPVPQKERHFSRGRRKKDFQKFAESLTQFAPRIPQKERFFLVMTPKNAPFRRKASFSARFSELSRKSCQSTTWANRANPGKTSAKRPQLTFPPPLTQEWRIWTLACTPLFFCCCFQPFYVWGGGGLCLFISRHRLFALICLVCCFWCFFFIFLHLFCVRE